MENEAITAYRQRRAAFEATFERHLAAGVVFYSADGILIDDTVEIAPGAVILPGTILRGETKMCIRDSSKRRATVRQDAFKAERITSRAYTGVVLLFAMKKTRIMILPP